MTVVIDRSQSRWYGETVCIIASGPSLTRDDCDFVKTQGWKTISINDSYKVAPFSDVLYACDNSWWKVHHETVKLNFKGELWTQDKNAAEKYNINYIPSIGKPGLGLGSTIHQGANSGYQSANLAFLWGANRIIFLGLDCSPDKNGKTHWFGLHGPGLSNSHPFERWIKNFETLANDLEKQNVEVINASRETSLTCFKRKFINEF